MYQHDYVPLYNVHARTSFFIQIHRSDCLYEGMEAKKNLIHD